MDNVSQEAEMSVIGGILLEAGKVLPLIVDIIKPKHFYISTYEKVYELALGLSYEQKAIDVITIMEKMKSLGYGEEETKISLSRAMEMYISLSRIKPHAEVILDNYRARKVTDMMLYIQDNGVSADSVNETLDNLSGWIETLSKSGTEGELIPVQKILPEAYYEFFNKDRLKQKVNIGFRNIDSVLEGMYPGNLVLLGARPSVGKTALALSMMSNIAQTGKRIAFYSLEMSRMELMERIVSSKSDIPLTDIRNRNIDDRTTQIAKSTETVYRMPLCINDSAEMTVNTMRNQCRFKKFDIIFIDYLQLMKGTEKTYNRYEEIGQISRGLKSLAKELNVVIIALVQLNRVTKETDEPNVSDIRESGQLEQDADVIMMLWRVEKDIIGCKVAKNRNGKTGKKALEFQAEKMQFYPTPYNFEEKEKSNENKTVPWNQ